MRVHVKRCASRVVAGRCVLDIAWRVDAELRVVSYGLVDGAHAAVAASGEHRGRQDGPDVRLGAVELHRVEVARPVVSADHVQQPVLRDNACNIARWAR